MPANAANDTSDRELIFNRLFNAPRELVFEAWTDPKHVAQWWGPNGFRTTIFEMDVRPGGVWRLIMHGPDGRDYKNRIVFLEVVKPERLVYKHDPEPGSEPVSFQVTVTFDEDGAKTRVTMRMVFPSVTERQLVVDKYGAVEGARQTLERLAGHLLQMVAVTQDPNNRGLVITRVFEAPREIVFKAWKDPDRLKQWWGPKGFTNPVCELDLRPGGAIRIHMRAPDGTVYPMTGVFREILEPERLVFASTAFDADGNPLFEILNTIIFEDHVGRTKLTVNAIVTSATPLGAPYLAGMEQGWSQSLDRLADFVKRL